MSSKNLNYLSVFFRFDCNPSIGFGHAIRCLAIADALKKQDINCFIAYSESSADFLPRHLMEGISGIVIPHEQELFEFLPNSSESIPNMLIIDHYGEAQINLSAPLFYSTLKVMIDDFKTCTNLPCDILINPNIKSDLGLSEPYLRLLGPSYAPIRQEIRQLCGHWEAHPRQNCMDECLISIGATDPLNLTCSVLKALTRCPQKQRFRFTVLLASGAPHVDTVKALCSKLKTEILAELVLDARDIGLRYKQAHCCIGAAGSSAWERCCVGLPTAQLVVADNQQHIQDELLVSGAVVGLPHPDDPSFCTIMSNFLQSAIERDASFIALSDCGQELVDGNGAKKIAKVLVTEMDI